jgi:uncharacterized protein YxeA
MKNILNIVILFLIISILGCTIAKRRYLGGYYIHTNRSPVETSNITSKRKQPISNKIPYTSVETYLQPIAKPKTAETIIKTLPLLSPIIKSMGNKTTLSFVNGNMIIFQNYISEQDTMIKENTTTKDYSRKDDRYARVFFILGLLLGLILLYVVAHILYFNSSESSISVILL